MKNSSSRVSQTSQKVTQLPMDNVPWPSQANPVQSCFPKKWRSITCFLYQLSCFLYQLSKRQNKGKREKPSKKKTYFLTLLMGDKNKKTYSKKKNTSKYFVYSCLRREYYVSISCYDSFIFIIASLPYFFKKVSKSAYNWCLQMVVPEKTLERPLGKKIKSVNSKGNQPWIFTGRTDAEAEAPILWPPDAKKSQLTGKDPDAGQDWGQEKAETEDEMVGWHHQLNGLEFEWTAEDTQGERSLMCCSSGDHKGSDTT